MSLELTLGLQRSAYPDFGQVFYMVDTDYRTAAQGWSRSDRTGPLDLYEARKAGRGGAQYVYRTGDYTSDAVALQAGIDAQTDFRGDVLYFTPGNYSIATARTVNVPDARWLGPPVSHPSLARVTITAAIAAAFDVTAAADRMEFGYLRFVPLTAETMWDVAAVDGLHVHDCFHDSDGIGANVLTIFWAPATSVANVIFDRNYIVNDAAQGPWINFEGIVDETRISNFEIFLQAGTWAAAIDFEGVGAVNAVLGPGTITGTSGAALTSLATLANKTSDTGHGVVYGIRASTAGPAATALVVPAGLAAEFSIVDCWRAVDMDAASPNFTSGGAITWESGLPYTG